MSERARLSLLAPPLHNLEQEEFEVVGFGHAPYDGMVGRLLAFLDLAQLNAGIVRRAHEHFAEAVGIHEVRAAASGQVSAARQGFHGAVVDLVVATCSRIDGLAALRERRRVKNDEVVWCFFLGLDFGQQIEHVDGLEAHAIFEAVQTGIRFRHVDRELRDVDGMHVLGSASGSV